MEVSISKETITVRLSRRNLESLLAKLDGHPPNSACTIYQDYPGTRVIVVAEQNGTHYKDRTPGPMHPDTEEDIR